MSVIRRTPWEPDPAIEEVNAIHLKQKLESPPTEWTCGNCNYYWNRPTDDRCRRCGK